MSKNKKPPNDGPRLRDNPTLPIAVVAGAGLAGVAVANKAFRAGLREIVLEARNAFEEIYGSARAKTMHVVDVVKDHVPTPAPPAVDVAPVQDVDVVDQVLQVDPPDPRLAHLSDQRLAQELADHYEGRTNVNRGGLLFSDYELELQRRRPGESVHDVAAQGARAPPAPAPPAPPAPAAAPPRDSNVTKPPSFIDRVFGIADQFGFVPGTRIPVPSSGEAGLKTGRVAFEVVPPLVEGAVEGVAGLGLAAAEQITGKRVSDEDAARFGQGVVDVLALSNPLTPQSKKLRRGVFGFVKDLVTGDLRKGNREP